MIQLKDLSSFFKADYRQLMSRESKGFLLIAVCEAVCETGRDPLMKAVLGYMAATKDLST